MNRDNIKILCLIAITLTASGCGGDSDTDTQLSQNDNALITDETATTTTEATIDDIATTELTDSTDTSGGIATPVQPVSSAQMDAFVGNPLLTAIPTELNGGTLTVLPGSFIINPLMD